MATVYVNTDAAAAGGDGSQGNPYKTLAEALTPYRLAGSTSTPVTIRCSGATADPGVSGLASAYSLDHTAWEFVTSPTNYIEVIGDNTSGKWDATKYHIQVTNRAGIYNQYAAHVRIHNVQVQIKATSTSDWHCVRLSTANNDLTNGQSYFLTKNCVFRKDPTSTNGNVFGTYNSVSGPVTPDDVASRDSRGELYVVNCLFIGTVTNQNDRGFSTDDGVWARVHARTYNCTAAKAAFGFETPGIARNLLATGCGFGVINLQAGSDYIAIDDGNGISGGGTHNNNAATPFTFVDAAGGDYHLASNDAGARNLGTDLSGLGIFTDDIDGGIRTGTWDIGADEQGAVAPPAATGGYAGWQGAVLSVGF